MTLLIKKLKESSVLHVSILLAVAFLSFHEVLKMYFFRDGFTILYNLSQNLPYPYPYTYIEQVSLPIYRLFHLNPMAYFAYGFLFFLISAFIFYLFTHELLSKKSLAFMASLIYVTSPIGIIGVVEMITYQTGYFALSLLLITLFFYSNFIKETEANFMLYQFLSY